MGVPHPQVAGAGEVSAAPAASLREAPDRRVRALVPLQVSTRRAGLLARLPFPAAPRLRLRRLLPRLVIPARPHRRIARVPADQPLHPGDPPRLLPPLRPPFP